MFSLLKRTSASVRAASSVSHNLRIIPVTAAQPGICHSSTLRNLGDQHGHRGPESAYYSHLMDSLSVGSDLNNEKAFQGNHSRKKLLSPYKKPDGPRVRKYKPRQLFKRWRDADKWEDDLEEL